MSRQLQGIAPLQKDPTLVSRKKGLHNIKVLSQSKSGDNQAFAVFEESVNVPQSSHGTTSKSAKATIS